MGVTSIEWTDFSVNPIRARLGERTGHYCEKLSQGCKNCYSSRLQPRFGLPQFSEQRGTPNVFLDSKTLQQVLRRRKPTKFFWCDMTDMFGEWVSEEWIAACFATMAATPQHVHQVLTKRPERALQWFRWAGQNGEGCGLGGSRIGPIGYIDDGSRKLTLEHWPLPNVWLGCSVENQTTAEERIPLLLECPAAVRFISAEPLLGPVDLTRLAVGHLPSDPPGPKYLRSVDALRGTVHDVQPHSGRLVYDQAIGRFSWVIVGSESGPGARPMDIKWAHSIVHQCVDAGVATFVKQIANANDRKGGNPEFWPSGNWPREWPETAARAAE